MITHACNSRAGLMTPSLIQLVHTKVIHANVGYFRPLALGLSNAGISHVTKSYANYLYYRSFKNVSNWRVQSVHVQHRTIWTCTVCTTSSSIHCTNAHALSGNLTTNARDNPMWHRQTCNGENIGGEKQSSRYNTHPVHRRHLYRTYVGRM